MISQRVQIFDRLAHDYDRSIRWLEWLWLRRLRRRLLKHAHGRVLEVGVGTGANLAHYPPGVTLLGVDLSGAMLAQAQARAHKVGRKAHLCVMDAAKLAFSECSFDTVVSTLSLCSMEDPAMALREMGRVCQTDGQLLLLEHGRSHVGWINRWLDRIAARHAQEYGCRPNLDMARLVQDAGLQVARTESHLWGLVKLFWATPGQTP